MPKLKVRRLNICFACTKAQTQKGKSLCIGCQVKLARLCGGLLHKVKC